MFLCMNKKNSDTQVVLEAGQLGFQMPMLEPFIFGAHHKDAYPAGNNRMGPAETRDGIEWGADFDPKAPWRMYHGSMVPGFPSHPHRGFETVTIVVQGFIDHSDSNGCTGRYGEGDVQWMTAGAGCQHAEMFPLIDPDGPNPLELFQLWLNLPAKDKMTKPDYRMFWNENVPVVTKDGGRTSVRVIAGRFDGVEALAPVPASWAADPDHHVGIFLIDMDEGGSATLPAVDESLGRAAYTYGTGTVSVAGEELLGGSYAFLRGDREITIEAIEDGCRMLVLEAEPIGEPVAAYGPFVMNTRKELEQAYEDYRRTGFGGWPWKSDDPVNSRSSGRFSVHSDGSKETPPA